MHSEDGSVNGEPAEQSNGISHDGMPISKSDPTKTIYERRKGLHGGIMAPAWPKGVSGNPKGRPKSSSIMQPLLRMLAAHVDEVGEGKAAKEMASDLLQAVRSGNYRKVRSILDLVQFVDGPPEKRIKVESVNAPPVIVLDASDEEAKAISEGFGMKLLPEDADSGGDAD